MSEPLNEQLYDQELGRLRTVCGEFLDAETRDMQLLMVGMIVVQCARVYNLSPAVGLVDFGSLFTGRPE